MCYTNTNLTLEKKHSTNLALSEVTDQVYANLTVDNYGLGIYLDFQGTFDTVDHKIRLEKLNHCGKKGIYRIGSKGV